MIDTMKSCPNLSQNEYDSYDEGGAGDCLYRSLTFLANHYGHLNSKTWPASGLQWDKTVGTPPAEAMKLENETLVNTIQDMDDFDNEVEFTHAQWAAFGINGLTVQHVVVTRHGYFQPRASQPLRMECASWLEQDIRHDDGTREMQVLRDMERNIFQEVKKSFKQGSGSIPESVQLIRKLVARQNPVGGELEMQNAINNDNAAWCRKMYAAVHRYDDVWANIFDVEAAAWALGVCICIYGRTVGHSNQLEVKGGSYGPVDAPFTYCLWNIGANTTGGDGTHYVAIVPRCDRDSLGCIGLPPLQPQPLPTPTPQPQAPPPPEAEGVCLATNDSSGDNDDPDGYTFGVYGLLPINNAASAITRQRWKSQPLVGQHYNITLPRYNAHARLLEEGVFGPIYTLFKTRTVTTAVGELFKKFNIDDDLVSLSMQNNSSKYDEEGNPVEWKSRMNSTPLIFRGTPCDWAKQWDRLLTRDECRMEYGLRGHFEDRCMDDNDWLLPAPIQSFTCFLCAPNRTFDLERLIRKGSGKWTQKTTDETKLSEHRPVHRTDQYELFYNPVSRVWEYADKPDEDNGRPCQARIDIEFHINKVIVTAQAHSTIEEDVTGNKKLTYGKFGAKSKRYKFEPSEIGPLISWIIEQINDLASKYMDMVPRNRPRNNKPYGCVVHLTRRNNEEANTTRYRGFMAFQARLYEQFEPRLHGDIERALIKDMVQRTDADAQYGHAAAGYGYFPML